MGHEVLNKKEKEEEEDTKKEKSAGGDEKPLETGKSNKRSPGPKSFCFGKVEEGKVVST